VQSGAHLTVILDARIPLNTHTQQGWRRNDKHAGLIKVLSHLTSKLGKYPPGQILAFLLALLVLCDPHPAAIRVCMGEQVPKVLPPPGQQLD